MLFRDLLNTDKSSSFLQQNVVNHLIRSENDLHSFLSFSRIILLQYFSKLIYGNVVVRYRLKHHILSLTSVNTVKFHNNILTCIKFLHDSLNIINLL